MAVLLEYKCPACGGVLNFNSDVQKLKCPYCDSELDAEAVKQLDEALNLPNEDQMNWGEGPVSHWEHAESDQLIRYVCNSCGGEITAEKTTSATLCPFCDNAVVMSNNLVGQLRPDLVIPFQLNKDAAIAAMHKHFSGKRLLPKQFKEQSHICQVKGIYVPFWLFDAAAEGTAHFHATRIRTWNDSRYHYTETSHFRIVRAGKLQFQNVPVDGSSKIADSMMESLEPFDLSKAVDFKTAYLAGFLANKYDISAADSQPRANQRIRASLEHALENTVRGYATVSLSQSSVQLQEPNIRYALLPVWLLTAHYKDNTYQFAMNGQTGKLVGDLPLDRAAYWKWWAGIAVSVAAAAYAVAWLVHFFL